MSCARVPIGERLLRKLVAQPNGCLEFQGSRDPAGYGHIGSGGKGNRPLYAHRAAWELVNGPIPEGMVICHRCDNPPCCNVDHLFLGTYRDNVLDMIAKGRHNPSRGTAHTNAKLNDAQVREIRRLDGAVSDGALAAQYGVSPSLVLKVRRGLAWRHVA